MPPGHDLDTYSDLSPVDLGAVTTAFPLAVPNWADSQGVLDGALQIDSELIQTLLCHDQPSGIRLGADVDGSARSAT
jgi:hypothetical protein